MNKPMNDLVKLVSQRANIPEHAAQTAIESVLSYLNEKAPVPLKHHLASLLGEEEQGEKKYAKGLGDMLSQL
ncbi:MAG: hypothetical protein RMM98_06135 [Acidobacteriota bacterium]|nr:hypothetical protein [Blastocatellia bacterium]MDW8239176.1 hypothetical protein [Acidobacteriota bacterium]